MRGPRIPPRIPLRPGGRVVVRDASSRTQESGRPPSLSASEVLTLAVLGNGRGGVRLSRGVTRCTGRPLGLWHREGGPAPRAWMIFVGAAFGIRRSLGRMSRPPDGPLGDGARQGHRGASGRYSTKCPTCDSPAATSPHLPIPRARFARPCSTLYRHRVSFLSVAQAHSPGCWEQCGSSPGSLRRFAAIQP